MERKDRTAREKLIRIVPREHQLKAAVTLALSNFEDAEVLEVILARLTDHKDQVRAASAIAASRFTDPKLAGIARERLDAILSSLPLDEDVRFDMEQARRILSGRDPVGGFRYIGNRQFVEDMTKDVEEKLLDLVNREARDVLGVEALTPLRAKPIKDRFRVDDSTSELRDLKDHLDLHPYFVPSDIPEPKLTITPGRVDPETGKPRDDGPEEREE
jgi:hypothetical protein